jgi:hypothetical protein
VEVFNGRGMHLGALDPVTGAWVKEAVPGGISMSDTKGSFIDLAVAGKVPLDNIDEFVEAWHKKPGRKSLHDFLGLSEAEYSLWVRDPDSLSYIVRARHEKLPLEKIISDNYQMAARAEDRGKVNRLKQWLQEQGKLE